VAGGGVSGSGGLAYWAWCSGEGWVFICLEDQCEEFSSITEAERRTCRCISDSLLAYGLEIPTAKNRALYYDTAFRLYQWLRQRASMLRLGPFHIYHAVPLTFRCHDPATTLPFSDSAERGQAAHTLSLDGRCYIIHTYHTVPMPFPCREPAVALRGRFQNGNSWHGRGTAWHV
jgi:hypothetical protein